MPKTLEELEEKDIKRMKASRNAWLEINAKAQDHIKALQQDIINIRAAAAQKVAEKEAELKKRQQEVETAWEEALKIIAALEEHISDEE